MATSRRRRPGAPAQAIPARVAARPRVLPPPVVEQPARRWPRIELMAALLAGAWLGRASVALPSALERGADWLLVFATAGVVMVAYRRAVRRRLARARAAHAGSDPRVETR
jgi:hypothetical protein